MIKLSLLQLSIVSALVLSISACAPATNVQGEKWVYIGEKNLFFDTDRSELPTRGYDNYRSFKFLVLNNAITFIDLEISFENGSKEFISAQNTVTPGSHSRNFSVNTRGIKIRSISFTYRKVKESSVRSRIKLYGLRKEE